MKKINTKDGILSIKNILLIGILVAVGITVYFLKYRKIESDHYEIIPLATHSTAFLNKYY
jgi:hypothetical protein